MGTRIAKIRAAVVALGAVLGTVVVAPPALAGPPKSKTVVLDQYPVNGECQAHAVAETPLGTLYTVTGSWRPYDSPHQGTVTCLVNGKVATVPIWLPSYMLPLAPAFPIVPYSLAAGTALVTANELTICVRVEYEEQGFGRHVAQHCE